MNATRLLALLASTTLALAIATATAFGHVERSSYWPDPAADTSVKPAAGGKVPTARSLASALRKKPPGNTRVVCQRASLKKAIHSINSARKKGTVLRPSQGTKKLTARKARKLKRLNRALSRRCKFKSIQTAISKSRNNDRVVIMPGKYLESKSRAKPTNDPKCAQYKEESDDGQGAATYRYQANCPNDQNLIYLQGRALTDKPVPFPPRENRRGIPDEGPCIRCNVQIEGSGAKPEDVVIDLAKDANAKLRGPSDPLKEVGLRVDRADGTVIKNITTAHAAEHGIYIHETDGYLMTQVKFFYNKEYGGLMFASDHGLTTGCEGVGHGDSAIYPGGAPDTGEQTMESKPRVNNTITRCDIHHNTLGYSGTMGNATRVVNNDFYDNGTAIATDSFYAGGHPGYPQDGATFENNRIYSNNFNSYLAGSDVEPKVPVPVGVGILIAGGNGNEIRGNRMWDNWRRGTMLINVPDSFSGSSGSQLGVAPQPLPRQRDGDCSGRLQGAQRRRLLVGRGPCPGGQLLVQERHGHDRPARPAHAVELRQHEHGCDISSQVRRRARPVRRRDRGWRRLRPQHLLVVPLTGEAVAGRWRADGVAGARLRSAEGGAAGARLPPSRLDAVVQRAARPALVAAAAILLAGCGGEPAAPQPFGVKLQTATCTDWRESTPQQRSSAVDQLERTVAGPRKEGNTLPDELAYTTLDARCKPDFARGFLLYELYIRAAGFESLSTN